MLIETPALAGHETIILLWLHEAPESKAELDSVDAGIRCCEAGIGNMHEPHFRAPVVLAAEKMQAQRARSRKVHPRRSRWHLRIAEKRPASDFCIGRQAAAAGKIPFQRKRI